MALEISWFSDRYADADGTIDVLKRPGLGVAAPVPIGAASARSVVAPGGTRLARLVVSHDCRIAVGGAQVEAFANGGGGSEFFKACPEYVIGVREGEFIAVIAAASA